jgi:hypothetical protein
MKPLITRMERGAVVAVLLGPLAVVLFERPEASRQAHEVCDRDGRLVFVQLALQLAEVGLNVRVQAAVPVRPLVASSSVNLPASGSSGLTARWRRLGRWAQAGAADAWWPRFRPASPSAGGWRGLDFVSARPRLGLGVRLLTAQRCGNASKDPRVMKRRVLPSWCIAPRSTTASARLGTLGRRRRVFSPRSSASCPGSRPCARAQPAFSSSTCADGAFDAARRVVQASALARGCRR